MHYVTMRDEDGTQYLAAGRFSRCNVWSFSRRDAAMFPTMRKAEKAKRRAAELARRNGCELFLLKAR